METFATLVAGCVRSGATDLHLRTDRPVAIRRRGRLEFEPAVVVSGQTLETLLHRLTTGQQQQILAKRGSLDFSAVQGTVQMRVNVFRSASGLGMAIRFLPSVTPCIEDLNLHPSLRELCALPHGLILICGPTGHGKSTTIAAMLRECNTTRPCHVITLEDPIEYRFTSEKALIDQRELGVHFPSFEQGLLDVLREDADIIMVGELREPETMRLTVNAAEAGHLVIATLHAGTPEEALLRLCNAFGEGGQDFARTQIASCLGAVVVQRMETIGPEAIRAPVLSILRANPAVKHSIRENRLNQLDNILQTAGASGMFTFTRYREEFLERQPRLVPPSRTFTPAASHTVIPETQPAPCVYATPDTPAGNCASHKSGVAETRPPYRIGEDAPLEELVAQMRRATPQADDPDGVGGSSRVVSSCKI